MVYDDIVISPSVNELVDYKASASCSRMWVRTVQVPTTAAYIWKA